MIRKTRQEWAAVFGVSYPIMAQALAGVQPKKRMPGHLFDETTVRRALADYYARKRDTYREKAERYNRIVIDIGTRRIEE